MCFHRMIFRHLSVFIVEEVYVERCMFSLGMYQLPLRHTSSGCGSVAVRIAGAWETTADVMSTSGCSDAVKDGPVSVY